MGTPDLLHVLHGQGLRVWAEGDRLLVAPKERITEETRRLIREHKPELLAALAGAEDALPDPATEARRQTGDPTGAPTGVFDFSPPGDPANEDEALQERAAIMIEANGWDEATALREARWQADRERCWRTFLRNAARVLAAPEDEREALLAGYRAQAERRYGERAARDMAQSLASWVRGQGVH